jgi:GH24 family phage-related lysozyme (muramidase)
MLTLTPDGADFIARWEGFSSTVYRDAAGHPTIGVGHLIQPGETFTRITEGEALDLLMQDARRVASPVDAALLFPVKPYQADAIISLAFNVGGYAVARSTLVRRINENRLLDAAGEFSRWNRAGGRVLRGLVKRRAAETRMFLFADYSGAP